MVPVLSERIILKHCGTNTQVKKRKGPATKKSEKRGGFLLRNYVKARTPTLNDSAEQALNLCRKGLPVVNEELLKGLSNSRKVTLDYCIKKGGILVKTGFGGVKGSRFGK